MLDASHGLVSVTELFFHKFDLSPFFGFNRSAPHSFAFTWIASTPNITEVGGSIQLNHVAKCTWNPYYLNIKFISNSFMPISINWVRKEIWKKCEICLWILNMLRHPFDRVIEIMHRSSHIVACTAWHGWREMSFIICVRVVRNDISIECRIDHKLIEVKADSQQCCERRG